jgi:hypothetical protein
MEAFYDILFEAFGDGSLKMLALIVCAIPASSAKASIRSAGRA